MNVPLNVKFVNAKQAKQTYQYKNVYSLVILPTFRISTWLITIAVNTELRLLVMDSRSVQDM